MKNLILVLLSTIALVSGVSHSARGPAYGVSGTVSQFENITLIQSLSDLPDPVSGVITLEALTAYQIDGSLDLGANRIVGFGDNSMFGKNPYSDSITSSNAGNCISGEDTNMLIQELTLMCPNGVLFDFKNTAGNEATKFFVLENSLVTAGTKLGNFENLARAALFISGSPTSISDGFTFSGSLNGEFAAHFFATNSVTGTLFDFGTSIFREINISNSPYVASATNTWISGLVNGGNILAGNIGQITHNSVTGGFMPVLTNISASDEEWRLIANTDVADTNPGAHDGFVGNATATTIGVGDGDDGNPKILAGTWIVASSSHFTCIASGRCTYTGINPVTRNITTSIKFTVSSGTNKNISFFVAFNGTVRTGSEIGNNVDANDFKSSVLLDQITFTTNDYVEIWLENNTDTIDVVVDAIHRVLN